MRRFTNNEREIVDSIVAEVDKSDNNLISIEFLIVPMLNKYDAYYERYSNYINVKYESSRMLCINSNTELGNDLLFRYSVISLLEKEGFIFFIDRNSVGNIVGNDKYEKYGHFELCSNSLVTMLSHTFDYMYVTENLIDMVKSGYVSVEERTLSEASKQTRNSIIQMWIGISALFLALISFIYSQLYV